MALLEVRDLRKRFGGVRALDGVSFSVGAGEMVALIGPNGAGKSTCFNVVGGQLRPDHGRVTLAGADITGREPRALCRLGVGRTFQITAAFGSLTVRENVQAALLARRRLIWRGWRPARSRLTTEAEELLARVGLRETSTRAASVLAYGDLKRLEFAMALAGEPRLLLMDEPTSGTASAERASLIRLVRDLARANDVAVLFTEHDMDIVFAAADRVIVLARGTVLAEGAPSVVRADPTVRAVYLGV